MAAYQAVDLVCDGGGEDSHAFVPVDGVWKVVVLVCIVDPLEAHAHCGTVSNL